MKILFFYVICLSISYAFFMKLPFLKRFSIQSKEIRRQIKYKLPIKQQRIINKIQGFYGLIGPDVDISSVTNMFDLFTGDGIIQGIFFDKGELVFVKHMIRTDKIIYEMENGRIPNNHFTKILFTIGNKMGVLPNILGLANTAFMKIRNKHYVLYERDVPYEISLNFHNKTLSTVNKINLHEIEHFSAHTKVSNIIETIDYHVATNKVSYYQLDENLEILLKRDFSTMYMPVIHDIITTKNKVVIMDSPLGMDITNMLHKSIPIILEKDKRTWIHILNKNDLSIERFSINKSLYIFHYADYKETNDYIEIYASQYDDLDFSDLDIKGRYRMIRIDKNTKEVFIIKNPELENLDIEFPISYENKVVFRSITNKINNGFVICNGLKVVKKLEFENRFFCGEPVIKTMDKVPYLITLSFELLDKEKGILTIINMHSYEVIEIPLHLPVTIGFHSAFFTKTKGVSPSYNAQ